MFHLFGFSNGLDQGSLICQQFCYELWVSPAEKSALMQTHAKCTICRREVHKSALTHFMILQWDSTKHSLLTGNAPHSPRVCEGVVWDSVSKDRISMFSQHSISQAALIYFCAFYDYKSLQKSAYTRKIGAFFFRLIVHILRNLILLLLTHISGKLKGGKSDVSNSLHFTLSVSVLKRCI